MKKNFLFFCFLIMSFWAAFGSLAVAKTVRLKLAGQVIKAEVVETRASREKGLSGQKSLAKDQGMLFVFDRPDYYAFWMKEMKFPIDIVWIERGRVVDIVAKALPDNRPGRPVYQPRAPASLVLELSADFAKKYGLKIGDKIEMPPGLTNGAQ